MDGHQSRLCSRLLPSTSRCGSYSFGCSAPSPSTGLPLAPRQASQSALPLAISASGLVDSRDLRPAPAHRPSTPRLCSSVAHPSLSRQHRVLKLISVLPKVPCALSIRRDDRLRSRISSPSGPWSGAHAELWQPKPGRSPINNLAHAAAAAGIPTTPDFADRALAGRQPVRASRCSHTTPPADGLPSIVHASRPPVWHVCK